MCICDMLVEVRASRSISACQVGRLEKALFGAGAISRHQLDLLFLIDSYAERADASWPKLLSLSSLLRQSLALKTSFSDFATQPFSTSS